MRKLWAGQRCIEGPEPQDDVRFIVSFGVDLSTAAMAEKTMLARRGLLAVEITGTLQDEIFLRD